MVVNAFSNQGQDAVHVSSPILSCPSKIGFKDRVQFILELSKNGCELLHLMIQYREELTADEDKKLHRLLSYLLEKTFKMDPTNFKFVGQALGLVQGDESYSPDGIHDKDDLGAGVSSKKAKKDAEATDPKQKKAQTKKKQSKLMKKMKMNAQKFLEQKEEDTTLTSPDIKASFIVEEDLQCAFCQE